MLHALAGTVLLLESLGHQVDEARIDLGLGWDEYVEANARLWSANLTASVDEMAAAFGRLMDSTTLEPVTLPSYHYGQQVSAAQFIMSVPAGADPGSGLPVGMRFAAGYGREDQLFRLAGQLEQAAPTVRPDAHSLGGNHSMSTGVVGFRPSTGRYPGREPGVDARGRPARLG